MPSLPLSIVCLISGETLKSEVEADFFHLLFSVSVCNFFGYQVENFEVFLQQNPTFILDWFQKTLYTRVLPAGQTQIQDVG